MNKKLHNNNRQIQNKITSLNIIYDKKKLDGLKHKIIRLKRGLRPWKIKKKVNKRINKLTTN